MEWLIGLIKMWWPEAVSFGLGWFIKGPAERLAKKTKTKWDDRVVKWLKEHWPSIKNRIKGKKK